jgi:hypothetical protein
MAEQGSERLRDPVVLAMERVLAAEQAAEARLQDSRQQADARVAAARARGAAIGRRAEARIARLHTAYLQKIDGEIARLKNQQASASETSAPPNVESGLLQAAERLAAKLTGGP